MNGGLQVENLGKSYRAWGSEWRRVRSWFNPVIQPREEHWALRGASFRIQPGESVGIVGQNGAGKSTLLKLITGTTSPTEGRVETQGRLSAMLELGMGFNPEFSGRQNATHTARLMGCSEADIERVMPAVADFSEVGDYFDQPVRVYSSGMQMRVAFSVATAIRPDILIIDEALAVGDVFFQQKCFDRIRRFQQDGTAILFVSHSMSAIYALCTRALLLHAGRIALDASPREVVDLYNAKAAHQRTDTAHQVTVIDRKQESLEKDVLAPLDQSHITPCDESLAIGSFEQPGVVIRNIELLVAGMPVNALVSESELAVCLTIEFASDFSDPHIGFQIRNSRGEPVFMTNTYCMGCKVGPVVKGETVTAKFSFKAGLTPGDYTITAGVADEGAGEGIFRRPLARTQDAIAFTILRNMDAIAWSGVYNLNPRCELTRTRHEKTET